MRYLKRNINILLLIMCIVLVGYSLTLMTYYETTYGSVTDKYYEKVSEYENLIQDLQERENRLNETSFELTRKIQDKEKLDELYTGLSEEKDDIEGELSSTKTTLNTANAELSLAESELEDKTQELSSVLSDVDDVADDIDNQIASIVEDIADDYNASEDDIEDYFSDMDDLVDDLRALS